MPRRLSARSYFNRQIPIAWLFAAITGYLGLCQLLLWRFLGIFPVWVYGAGVALIAALCIAIARHGRLPAVGLRTVAAGIAVAAALLMMGGEGRLFYANIDWQVRDAVLRDMAVNPWPFVYTARATADVLRAPLGVFFVPALAAKAFGAVAADWVLLGQNALLLGLSIAAASRLFDTTTERMAALAIFFAFSGLDILGEYLTGPMNDHMEGWAGVQFSSTITLAFWVPQHAIAGWIGALAYLLWRRGDLSLAAYLAVLPLTALWSPLGLMGALPFAAFAAGTTVVRRRLLAVDVLLPAGASLLALPGLLYMGAANHEVGIRQFSITPARYALFEAIEVWPYLVALFLALSIKAVRTDWPALLIVTFCLLAVPFVQIGWSVDFAMRASITALAILAMLTARLILSPGGGLLVPLKIWMLLVLSIGAMTGIAEIRRAFTYPVSPRGRCSFFKAWDQSFAHFPKGSYLAPLGEIAPLVRPPNPARVSPIEPDRCWTGQWRVPSGV